MGHFLRCGHLIEADCIQSYRIQSYRIESNAIESNRIQSYHRWPRRSRLSATAEPDVPWQRDATRTEPTRGELHTTVRYGTSKRTKNSRAFFSRIVLQEPWTASCRRDKVAAVPYRTVPYRTVPAEHRDFGIFAAPVPKTNKQTNKQTAGNATNGE